jgi:hypothetical protein
VPGNPNGATGNRNEPVSNAPWAKSLLVGRGWVIVRIANQERELRTLVGEYGEARAVGRIRNRPSVDVGDDGAVHKSIESVAIGIVESKTIQGVDLAGNEQEMVKQPLRQLQRRDAEHGRGLLASASAVWVRRGLGSWAQRKRK